MSETIAGGTVETPSTEELQASLAKAEAKIVELKKTSKAEVAETPKEETPKEEPVEAKGLSESDVQKLLATERYMDANPELRDFKDTFSKLTSSGLSDEGAKAAILADNPELVNRQKTNSTSITGDIVSPDKSTYTMEEVTAIAGSNQRAYNELMEKVDKGEASIT